MAKKAAKKSVPNKSLRNRRQLLLVDTAAPAPSEPPRRKLIAFDSDTFAALDVYRRDSMKDWEELAEEAFRDLLNKHGRTADLRTALKRSVKQAGGANKPVSNKNRTTKKSPRTKRI